jgi:hypothetical protein
MNSMNRTPEPLARPTDVRKGGVSWAPPVLAAALAVLGTACLFLMGPERGWAVPVATAALVGACVALASWPIVASLAVERDLPDDRIRHQLEEQTRLLAQIHEHTMLSEGSKRVIYRPKELQLLRSAIEDDIARGDYDAALTLCRTMAEEFGFREEAERFRDTIEAARRESYESQVREAMGVLDDALNRRDWAAAHSESARMKRLFPEASVVSELDARIGSARVEHKQHLTERFLAAASHGDVENAMGLLRELDRYLTRAEAQELQEAASGVVSRHRENLSVQFNIAVRDRNWTEAVKAGNDIVREFPNSKMAGEVRAMLDVLRTRATQAAVAAGG